MFQLSKHNYRSNGSELVIFQLTKHITFHMEGS